jgi:hypothetical protein
MPLGKLLRSLSLVGLLGLLVACDPTGAGGADDGSDEVGEGPNGEIPEGWGFQDEPAEGGLCIEKDGGYWCAPENPLDDGGDLTGDGDEPSGGDEQGGGPDEGGSSDGSTGQASLQLGDLSLVRDGEDLAGSIRFQNTSQNDARILTVTIDVAVQMGGGVFTEIAADCAVFPELPLLVAAQGDRTETATFTCSTDPAIQAGTEYRVSVSATLQAPFNQSVYSTTKSQTL